MTCHVALVTENDGKRPCNHSIQWEFSSFSHILPSFFRHVPIMSLQLDGSTAAQGTAAISLCQTWRVRFLSISQICHDVAEMMPLMMM